MTLKHTAQKLRHAAEVLEELIGLDKPTSNETPTTASRLRKAMRRGHKPKHWTQKPENRSKLLRMVARSVKVRRAS